MEWITVTTHAGDRWHERTNSAGVGPIVAWNEGHPVSVPTLEADEVRHHSPTDTLLVRQ